MELRLAVLLCTVLAFSPEQVVAQLTAVLSPGAGYNASLGSTVTFTCIISGSTSFLWFANDTSEFTELIERGITQEPSITQPDSTIVSRLNVSATIQNDGIEIFCLAVTIQMNRPSETVMLSIQGLLSSPSALEIINQNQTGQSQLLTWTPPPTLDLTYVEPDISYYNVCSTILDEVSCLNVQATEYLFANIRIGIDFSVSAVNVVGEGNASTISHQPCDPTTVPTQVDGDRSVSITISLQSDGANPTVEFWFRKGDGEPNCFNLYLIEASSSSQDTPLTLGPVIPSVEGQGETVSLTLSSGLTLNTVYTVNIVSVNVNGNESSTGLIQFSTYDIQSVVAFARPGVIAVTCTFTTGSTADSVLLRICEIVNGNISITACRDLSVPRNSSASKVIKTLSSVQPGVYFIVGVTVKRGNKITDFSSKDLSILNLQNIQVTVGPPLTTTMATDFTVAGAGVGALGTLFLVGISVIIVCVVHRKLSKRKRENEPKCVPNAGCSTTLELTKNVAYESTGSRLTPAPGVNMEQHTYEEIQSGHTHTKEPLYDVIEPSFIQEK